MDGGDVPVGDPFWFTVATRRVMQRTGGSLMISRADWGEVALHGFEGEHDKLVIDSLFFVKDTVSSADKVEHDYMSAWLPMSRCS